MWKPNLDVAVEALRARIAIKYLPDSYFSDLTKTALEASGANARMQHLESVMHAAHEVQRSQRDELTRCYEALARLNDKEAA